MKMLATEIWMTPEKDAYVSEYYPNENFGEQPYLFSNRYLKAGDIYRFYLKFNLFDMAANHIPNNSAIRFACLKLPVFRNEVTSTNTLYAYRVLQDWSQDSITWNTQPILALSADGAVSVSSGFIGIVNMDVTALVKWWFSGLYKNFGIMITCEESENSLLGFFSTEYPNSDYWPRLIVGYTENCCVGTSCDCKS